MRKLISSTEQLSGYESNFREKLLQHLNTDHLLVSSFDPYIASKLLRYLFAFNDSSDGAVEIYKSLSLLLTQTIADRQRALVNARTDDPLIDVEFHDIVDIVRVYAAFANRATIASRGEDMASSVPPLFHNDFEQTTDSDELELFEDVPLNADLGEMSLHLLKTL